MTTATVVERMRARNAVAVAATPQAPRPAATAAHDEALWANAVRGLRDVAAAQERARRVADLDDQGRDYGYGF